ncbi:unannotated protein [freshwater metagenome]|uniref:Unannotated protein n=1 Tax=freshwater metagenome TaxID=449393 RepID=A0A6J7CZE3_9ZZZZ|nr:hypothetical protein [Actinomycetota bacterium]MUH57924.1 hypothetical protein [Actinomycetota bacterium]
MADITTMASTLGRETATKVREFAATNSAAKKTKDAIYTIVGLGVLSVQKINVAAKAARTKVDETVDTEGLNAAVKSNTADITSAVKRTAATVDAKVNEVIAMAEAIVTPYEEKLPTAAREVAAKVRAMSTAARAKVTEALHDDVVVEAPVVSESETTPA